MSKNKVALVTGAAKRIGKQTATLLHHQGFDIIIHCNNSAIEAEAFANELNELRANSACFIKANLNNSDDITELAKQAVSAYGHINVLINNASSFYPTEVGTVTNEIWDDLFGSNLKAPFFLIQALQASLAASNGVIINMVDIHAERPLKEYSVYCMAKAGLVMLTKSLSRELAPNIRVNGVAPGAILWHENDLSEQDKQQVVSEIALNRLGSPTNIAEAILYLVQADYVTGHILTVDGGRSINGGAKA